MDKLDKQIAIEKFVNTTEGYIEDISKLISFLRIEDPKQREMLDKSMNILNKKMRKVRKCKSVKDTDKYIKSKKVIKVYGEKE